MAVMRGQIYYGHISAISMSIADLLFGIFFESCKICTRLQRSELEMSTVKNRHFFGNGFPLFYISSNKLRGKNRRRRRRDILQLFCNLLLICLTNVDDFLQGSDSTSAAAGPFFSAFFDSGRWLDFEAGHSGT